MKAQFIPSKKQQKQILVNTTTNKSAWNSPYVYFSAPLFCFPVI